MTQEQLYKYLRGESTTAERHKVVQWINASPDNMHAYRTLRGVYDTMLCSEPDLHLHNVASTAHHSGNIIRSIAATVAVICVCAATYFFGIRTMNESDHATMAVNQINCITTPIGHRAEFTLSDGTHVWLSSNSCLTLPADGSQREVTLAGEAFFAVAKDATHPFVVNTSGRSITVHGTRFNVSAYPGNRSLDVQLYEGAVSVTDSASIRTVALIPGQHYHGADGQYEITTFEQFGSEPLWIQGIHHFRNCTFAEILTHMSHVYNAKLIMESSWTESQRCTCKFHEADGLENMLESLDNIRPFTYQWDPESRLLRIK